MDLLRCYTNEDEENDLPEPRKLPSPKSVFGVPRRTRFNLETTTKRAKKVEKKVMKNPYGFEEHKYDNPDFI
jgi:hypothetical protein